MQNKKFSTPILFIIYNRPKETFDVFKRIRELEPSSLFISADGPNSKKQGDKEKCKKTREIIKLIDWPCKVKTRFLKENHGCGLAVSSAITWFFSNVKEGIILEDDCLPSDSFFPFCTELLKKYKNNKKIMMICGTNFLGEWKSKEQDYHFSKQISLWGWATWKRSWKCYKHDLAYLYNPQVQTTIKSSINNKSYYHYIMKKIDKVRKNEIDSWGYRWMASIYFNNGKIISPSKNLISNIGFSHDAVHTKNPFSWMAKIRRHSIKFPLKMPKNNEPDTNFDRKIINNIKNPWNRLTNKIFEIITK